MMAKLWLWFRDVVHKYYHYRKGKKLMHVETPHYKTDKLLEYCKKIKPTCFCITPTNYDFVKSEYWIDMTREEFEEFLIKLYKQLKVLNIDLYPHVHVSLLPEKVPSEVKRKMIADAYLFFREKLGITPTKIIFGWHVYDDEMAEICRKFKMEIIGWSPYIYDRFCERLLNEAKGNSR